MSRFIPLREQRVKAFFDGLIASAQQDPDLGEDDIRILKVAKNRPFIALLMYRKFRNRVASDIPWAEIFEAILRLFLELFFDYDFDDDEE